MRFAYADPPYFGLCSYYKHFHGSDGRCWDDVETHRLLVARLVRDYPDGWAMSLQSPALKTILPLCPDYARVGAWIKPFASFKPGMRVAYAWEPIIFVSTRQRHEKDRLGEPTTRDYCVANIALKKGLKGAKPEVFCEFVLDLLGYRDGDALDDLFSGTGVMSRVLAQTRIDFAA